MWGYICYNSWTSVIHYYRPKSIPYLDFLSLYPVSFFLYQGPVQNHITFSCHVSLGSTWLWVSHTFLDNFEEFGNLLVRMSPNWGLSHVFLMIKPRLWVFGRKTAEIKCPSHHVVSRSAPSAGPSLLSTLTTGLRPWVLSCHVTLLHPHCPLWKVIISAHI